jgi:hypothetical protein
MDASVSRIGVPAVQLLELGLTDTQPVEVVGASASAQSMTLEPLLQHV